ncbi:hypothetical protein AX16_007059 [Volvariella volvacea WC 439]|nr:hypothetical protein AX16_007059 [Volvariella volvacea WC 439]
MSHPPPELYNGPDDGPAVIQVYWNIIAANETYEGGWIPDEQISEQMDVINKDYNGTGLVFNHTETNRIIRSDWFSTASDDMDLEMEMKTQLRKGGPETLNIYTVQTQLLGRAAFPVDYESDPIYDGILLNYGTLPGGFLEPYNLGRTLTHEAGHWVGLYHTFEGGCEGGDEVDDTPAEAEAGYGCPIGRDSCPNDPGLDPIQNFMDYSNDDCMDSFTPGQIARLQDQIRQFRKIAV